MTESGGVLSDKGWNEAALWAEMDAAADGDVDWHDGQRWGSPVYFAGEDVRQVGAEAYRRFISANGLYAAAFPSVTGFERDVVQMTRDLLHAPEGSTGIVTSGGSESIMLGVKAARDRAKAEKGITEPEMVVPLSAHPAFNKASEYFRIKITRTALTPEFRADVAAMEAATTENTVLLAGSAPNWPFGTIDPIPDMAALAAERDINFHTDSCLGGFFLPFAEQLEYPVGRFDFRIDGVSSISADLHKFGYAMRGASTVTWRDERLAEHMAFDFDAWPSGRYRTMNMAGSRPGGAVAAAWAVMHYLGREGYQRAVDEKMRIARALVDGINAIPGLKVNGDPAMCLFSYQGTDVDIFAVADALEAKGWTVSRGKDPESVHLMLYGGEMTPGAPEYLADLRGIVTDVRARGLVGAGRSARYGST